MRVTAGLLRQIIVNPGGFVSRARSQPVPSRQYPNPQRQWMEAAWRRYFETSRNASTLLDTFHQRASRRSSGVQHEGLVRGGEVMLHRFLEWDADEESVPRGTVFPRAMNVEFSGHTLAVPRHLLYLAPTGYRIRQLWTDRDLRPDHGDASLMITAVMLCAEAELGSDRVEAVEAWQLRQGERMMWSRQQLAHEAPALRQRLDEIDRALSA